MELNTSLNTKKSIVQLLFALWRYRGFVFSMVMREFQSRYRGSLLGSIWAVIQPMAMIFIYTIIFSKVMSARLSGSQDTLAYGIFICAGLLPWTFFSELLSRSMYIFIDQGNLLKKVIFPRSTLPVILLFSTGINFIITFCIFLIFLIATGRFPGLSLFGILPLLIIQQGFALGLGMFLGTLNVFFRDIGHLISIVLQFWFWLTPIVYPISILPERVRNILQLNPMTQLITSFQQIILQRQWPQWETLHLHAIGAFLALLLGFWIFRRLSGDIVDEL
jgi:lipopolysaccharide transport system permease protein